MGYYVINPKDNVKVNLDNGHKYALKDIKKGEEIIKYGFPIGIAIEDIEENVHVHSHNLKTLLAGLKDYTYSPNFDDIKSENPITIDAFVRDNGDIGIRNDIWIVNTVGCINKTAEKIARLTDSYAFPHPYGCSQLGEDYTITQKVLCGLIKHPNAGGVLVLGLGCENNNIPELKKILGDYNEDRVRFLNIQDCEDEITEAAKIINELKEICKNDVRKQVSISKLKLGLKCGGSDGLSGITANPLCGKVSDGLIAMGGTAVLTEVPEMFGAEQILMNRCENEFPYRYHPDMQNAQKPTSFLCSKFLINCENHIDFIVHLHYNEYV